MERYIGMDVHAASCTLAVISEKGRKLKDFPVETGVRRATSAMRMVWPRSFAWGTSTGQVFRVRL